MAFSSSVIHPGARLHLLRATPMAGAYETVSVRPARGEAKPGGQGSKTSNY